MCSILRLIISVTNELATDAQGIRDVGCCKKAKDKLEILVFRFC